MDVQSILVLKQALDAQRLQGEAAVQLIRAVSAVGAPEAQTPNAASPRDSVSVPEPGKGALVDVRA
jgi:hypothetical protein